MLKTPTALAAAGLALTMLSAPATLAQDAPTADTVIATVNGTEITLGEMLIARSELPQQYQTLPDDVLFTGLLDQIVEQQLLADQLENETQRMTFALNNQRRSLAAGEVITTLVDEAITDDAVQAAYEEMVAGAEPETEYNAAHILVETEEEAIAIKEELDAGADFATLAQERSTGPSGPSGGDLGWFGQGRMVAPFEAAVVALEPGQISDPVETQFGWHIVVLNETRIQAAPSLEELRPEIQNELRTAAIDTAVTGLKDSADISLPEEGAFDPSIIGMFNLLEE